MAILTNPSPRQAIFEAERGLTFHGDIAIDDVSFSPQCYPSEGKKFCAICYCGSGFSTQWCCTKLVESARLFRLAFVFCFCFCVVFFLFSHDENDVIPTFYNN